MSDSRLHVVVVGCGASGMMAAISAARAGAAVTVLEAAERPGKKLLLTGNGRCNLTTTNLIPKTLPHSVDFQKQEAFNGSSSPEAAQSLVQNALRTLPVEKTLALFREMGLQTMTEHGSYVYPASGQAASVLSVLLREMDRLQIKRKYREQVVSVARGQTGGWTVRTTGWTYPCDRVILSCGSRAGAVKDTADGYALCEALGLHVTKLLPALCALECRSPDASSKAMQNCAGARMPARVRAFADGVQAAEETGQLQWTHYGVSGIVVFNISRYITRALAKRAVVTLELDLLPGMEESELSEELVRLRERYPEADMKHLLAGLLPDRVIPLAAALGGGDAVQTARAVKQLRLEVTGLRPLRESQVCAGGVAPEQVDPKTLECLRDDLRGIYVTGELLDIDGPCGGYNLQWAWSSGYAAGKSAAR